MLLLVERHVRVFSLVLRLTDDLVCKVIDRATVLSISILDASPSMIIRLGITL